MSREVDPAVVTLFGGETRVLTLAALSSSPQPITGYRVTKLTEVQPIKVYEELRKLATAGFVVGQQTRPGRVTWKLVDPDLKRFFNRRVRINWPVLGTDARKGDGPEWRAVRAKVRSLNTAQYQSRPLSIPNREEFVRAPGKDAILASVGLKMARRGKRSE